MSEIKINKKSYPQLEINFDQIDFEVIKIIRDGKTLIFPLWEFWQVLEKYDRLEEKYGVK